MNKYVPVTIIVVLILSLFGFIFLRPKPAAIHYHAGFLVYVDGVKQDYTDSKYMKLEPCAAPGAKLPENPQLDKAHLHDHVGDVVHVEHAGAVWGDLFKNIHVTFNNGAPVHGFVNGKEDPNILAYPIKPYDSVIFVVGNNTGIDLTKAVTKAHIIEIEKKSETCGS